MSGTGFTPQQPQIGPVTYEDWAKSDAYHISHLIPEDPILEAAKKNSHDKGLPDIAVSTSQGKFLHLTAKAIGAKRILEVGTLGGYTTTEFVSHYVQLTDKPLRHRYSTIWLARALPDGGKLITLEISEKHAQVYIPCTSGCSILIHTFR